MKKIAYILTICIASALGAYAADVPTFPGGDAALQKYLSEHVVYPASAKEMGVEGVVTVGFIVNPDGTLTSVKAENLVDPDLESEAVRVVSGMPAWIPAEKEGAPVEAPSRIDVSFILE